MGHYENPIGEKVYRLFPKDEHRVTFTMDASKVYTIEKIIPYNVAKDYDDHYIIKCGEEEVEIPAYECVFVPKDTEDELERIWSFLSNNSLFPSDIHYMRGNENLLAIKYERGDHSHEHGWMRVIMEYIGWKQMCEWVTESDGSDNYSSVHVFVRAV